MICRVEQNPERCRVVEGQRRGWKRRAAVWQRRLPPGYTEARHRQVVFESQVAYGREGEGLAAREEEPVRQQPHGVLLTLWRTVNTPTGPHDALALGERLGRRRTNPLPKGRERFQHPGGLVFDHAATQFAHKASVGRDEARIQPTQPLVQLHHADTVLRLENHRVHLRGHRLHGVGRAAQRFARRFARRDHSIVPLFLARASRMRSRIAQTTQARGSFGAHAPLQATTPICRRRDR